jgi:photosystem II stability/assembly factor-like uncharacterized protein
VVPALWLTLAGAFTPIAARATGSTTFEPTGLDGGGLVNVVAFDPSNPGVVIAGGDNSGIYRSTDGGQSWSSANAGMSTRLQIQVASIAFSPTVVGKVYAAVGFQGTGGGLLVSTDDGRTWSLRSSVPQFSASINTDASGLPPRHPRSTGTLLQFDDAEGFIYAATFQDGVMRSDDDGDTWTTLGLAGEHLRSLAMDPADPHVLYASAYGDGIWKTTTASTTGTFSKLTNAPAIAEDLAFVGSGLYAVGPNGLFRSWDGGAIWTELGAGQLPDGAVPGSVLMPTWFTVTGYVACGETVLYVGGQGKGPDSLMVSLDAGATWSSLVSDPAAVHPTEGGPGGPNWWLAGNVLATFAGPNYVTTQIAVDPAPAGCERQRILVAGRAGVFGTTDAGANWYPMTRGLGLTVVREIAADPNVPGRVYAAIADWGFISSTDAGVTVVRNAPPKVFDAFGVAVDPSTTPGTVYLATGRFGSNPAGEIWSDPDPASGDPWTNEGLGDATGDLRPVGLAVNEVGGSPVILAVVEGSGIWRKQGGTWTLVDPSVNGGAQLSFSWIPGSSVAYLYDHGTGIWRSNDAGLTWTKTWARPSPFDMTGYVAADPRDPSRLYASVGEVGLFRLDDANVGSVEGGQIAPQPVGELPFPGPIAVRSDGAVYAVELSSASGGPSILTSDDLGVNWSTVSDPFFAESGGFVRTLEVGPDSALWAGLYGDGMITRAAPSIDYRPDGLLATSTSAFVGNDIYNTTGVNQSLSQRVPRRGTAVFRWRIQNDGASADQLALLGPGSTSRFQVAYSVGTTKVTKAVVAGTYVKSLAAHAQMTITVKVTVVKGTSSGTIKSLPLRATSRSEPLKDVVVATVKVR